jgi:hypothetical protein
VVVLNPLRVDGMTDTELADNATRRVREVRRWLPPVDPAVFDCYIGRLAYALDPYTEADPIGILATLLAATGTHLGPGLFFPIGYERHPLLTWPIIIGPTGSGKKGSGYNAAKALLTSADTEFVACNIRSGLSTGEGLATVFAVEEGKPGKARLLPEGDCRLLAYEPEWASVMARMKREGNTLSATLRAAWEGGDMSTLNVDARVARRSHIGIIAHITPEEFRAKVSASDMAGGTYNRFLPIAVAQSKFLPNPTIGDPAWLQRHGAELAARLAQAGRVTTIGLDTDATTMWARLYLEFGADADAHGNTTLAQFTSRAAPNCLRIAATHAALDNTTLITPGHLTAAAALIRYSTASAAAVLTPTTDLDHLHTWITTAGNQGRTRKEIVADHFQGNTKADRITELLTRLIDTGRITHHRRPPVGGRGRPTDVYIANPTKETN